MREVAVQVHDLRVFFQVFLDHIPGLEEVFEGRCFPGPAVPLGGEFQGLAVALRVGDGTADIGPDKTREIQEELGWQVVDPGLDLAHRFVTEVLPGTAHREEMHRKTESFE